MSHDSMFMRWLQMTASFVAAFSAIYLGVLALGWDLLGLGVLIKNIPAFGYPLLYAVGVFGLISLVLLVLNALESK